MKNVFIGLCIAIVLVAFFKTSSTADEPQPKPQPKSSTCATAKC